MTVVGAPDSSEPKYYAVKRHLLEFIGSLEPGSAVPTERELTTDMQTSRTTVRQAQTELVVEGRLVRRHGSGTYVDRRGDDRDGARHAAPLRADIGSPMLIVSRQNFDSAGAAVELGRTWFRGDRVTLVTHLASEPR